MKCKPLDRWPGGWSRVLPLVCLLLPGAAGAQDLTGNLIGSVQDEQGAEVPGVRVRVTSPALIGGSSTLETNEKGRFRFWALPPGLYTLDVERPAFVPVREENIPIRVGGTIERTIVLKVASRVESVTVEGAGSRVEARTSGFETRFGPEYLTAIPGRRFSMFDFVKAAPGVSPTAPSSPASKAVSAFGSGTNENAFLLDGTNFTCPCSGAALAEPGLDVIQDIQIQTVGASAEFGNMQGAVFNVVTRHGGDRFRGDAAYWLQTGRLTSRPVRLACANCETAETGYERVSYRNVTTSLGGPLSRDHLWFFGGYEYLRDYDSQPGADPRFPRAYDQNKLSLKLTWQVTPGMRLVHSFYDEFSVEPQRPTAASPFETTLRVKQSVPTTTFGQMTYVVSSNTLLDARVGRIRISEESEPSIGSRSVPAHFDRATGISSGGPQNFGDLTRIRTTVKATMTYVRPGLAGADHEWKFGVQIEQGEHHAFTAIPTGTRYVDDNGRPFQSISRDPFTVGGLFNTTGLFFTDAISLGSRLVVNTGLRFDRSEAVAQDLAARDPDGRKTDAIIRGSGHWYTWNVVSPRLGVTAKLRSDGRTMLRASYGRFHQGILTAEFAPFHPGNTPVTTMAFESATGRYTRLVSVVDQKINLQLDREMRSPRTDEFSIGIERELARHLMLGATYVRKDGRDFVGWTDIGGVYREEMRTLADGRTVPVFALVNATSERRFFLTNPDGYSLTYNGLVWFAEKRLSHGWQAFASYTLSRTEGLQISSGAEAGAAQVSSALGSQFGRDPNSLTNARGRLPNDRPHIFRIMGSVDLGRTGVTLAANLQQFAGTPWAARTPLTVPQGSTVVQLEPRGTRRLPSQTLLDLRVSKAIPCRSLGRIDFLFDVLNALNESAAQNVATDNPFSPGFGQGTVFVDPRRAMVSVRLTLGR